MDSHRYLPDVNRVSVLTAAILLAFALTRVISSPSVLLDIQLAGVDLSFELNINTLLAVIAAGLAATGMDWMLRGHPLLAGKSRSAHLLLPMLTTLVIGIALYALPSGSEWWLGFSLGGLILVMVLLAEYVVVDSADLRYPLAAAGLTAISYALYLILAVALSAAGERLYLIVLPLFIAAWLTSLRTLHLQGSQRWEFGWATGIALVVTQIAAALHYWPLTSPQFGLALLGPVYTLTSLAIGILGGVPFRRAIIEPLVMLALIWGLAFVFR
jgi:hypothetical protein